MTRFRPQVLTAFKSLFDSTLFIPISPMKGNISRYGSNWLLSSLNNKFVKKNYFKTSPTKLTENSDLNKNNDGEPKSRAISLVQSILHGSPEVKEVERQTHSKLIARGKYVHDLQRHKIKPDRVDDYIKLISEHYPRIANDPKNSVHLCGSWKTEIGDLDSFFHLWEYQGYTGYHKTYDLLKKDERYQIFEKELRSMLQYRHNQICLEFAFWATSPPAVKGGIYELRSYQLRPGNLFEWETNWKHGLECRSRYCEPIGAWFCQLGALNYVHHMWQYPDLEDRKINREKAWNVDGWADTVYNTVRLIDQMEANILIPLPFSPLR